MKWNTATGTIDAVDNCSGSTLISVRVKDSPIDVSSAVNKTYVTTFPDGFSVTSGKTVDFNTNILEDIGTPTLNNHAATKGYVDAQVIANPGLKWGGEAAGSDGDAVISENTTLTSDMYYNDLTVNSGFTLTTNGFIVFVNGTATIEGTLDSGTGVSGTSANVAVPGQGGRNSTGSIPGLNGANGQSPSSAGTISFDGLDAVVPPSGTNGANGGSANAAVTGRGGIGYKATIKDYASALSLARTGIFAAAGAAGGAGPNQGAAGGGGGASAPTGALFAKDLVFGASAQLKGTGGNGGNGGGSCSQHGGGGGGGGNGPLWLLVFETKSGSYSTNYTVGTGGTGGTCSLSTGGNGQNGASGVTYEIDL